MATAQSEAVVLKLIAGLFNGSPGGGVLEELAAAVDNGLPVYNPGGDDLGKILTGSDAFKEIVPESATTEEKVELLLRNFGLESSAEEGSPAAFAAEYFTARIEDGGNLANIAYEAIVFLEQDDLPEEFAPYADLFTNKVRVATTHSDNYDSIATVDEGQSLFEGVTPAFPSTDVEALEYVESIVGEVPVDPPSSLVEALAALQVARDGRTEFLREAAENEDVAAEPSDDVAEAISQALNTTKERVADDHLEGLLDANAAATFKSSTTSAATQASLIADGRAEAQNRIDEAQEAVADYNAEIAKVSGLSNAISQAKTAAANEETAQAAFDDAGAEFVGALATFEARNSAADIQFLDSEGDVLPVDANLLDDLAKIVDNSGDDDPDPVELFTYVDGQLTAEGSPADYPGFNAFQSSLQTVVNAHTTLETAESAHAAAVTALEDIDDLEAGEFGTATNGKAVFDELAALEGVVEAKQDELQALEDAIADWQAVTALNTELGAQNDAVKAAQKVLEDSEEDGGFGVNLIELDDDKTAIDENAELFLFANEDASITNFGADDLVFFGNTYTAVALGEDQTINDRVGDANTLEVFWQVDGGNLNLYVEQHPVSGSATNVEEIDTITLVGVTEVAFEGGFVSLPAIA